jgi:hypothetical protein
MEEKNEKLEKYTNNMKSVSNSAKRMRHSISKA